MSVGGSGKELAKKALKFKLRIALALLGCVVMVPLFAVGGGTNSGVGVGGRGGRGNSRFAPAGNADSFSAITEIPDPFLNSYRRLSASTGVPWSVLAGIGYATTMHGTRSPYDTVQRGTDKDTHIWPDIKPKIGGKEQGATGMFLFDPELMKEWSASDEGNSPSTAIATLAGLVVQAAEEETTARRDENTTGRWEDYAADAVKNSDFWVAVINRLPIHREAGGCFPSLPATELASTEQLTPPTTISPLTTIPVAVGPPADGFAPVPGAITGDSIQTLFGCQMQGMSLDTLDVGGAPIDSTEAKRKLLDEAAKVAWSFSRWGQRKCDPNAELAGVFPLKKDIGIDRCDPIANVRKAAELVISGELSAADFRTGPDGEPLSTAQKAAGGWAEMGWALGAGVSDQPQRWVMSSACRGAINDALTDDLNKGGPFVGFTKPQVLRNGPTDPEEDPILPDLPDDTVPPTTAPGTKPTLVYPTIPPTTAAPLIFDTIPPDTTEALSFAGGAGFGRMAIQFKPRPTLPRGPKYRQFWRDSEVAKTAAPVCGLGIEDPTFRHTVAKLVREFRMNSSSDSDGYSALDDRNARGLAEWLDLDLVQKANGTGGPGGTGVIERLNPAVDVTDMPTTDPMGSINLNSGTSSLGVDAMSKAAFYEGVPAVVSPFDAASSALGEFGGEGSVDASQFSGGSVIKGAPRADLIKAYGPLSGMLPKSELALVPGMKDCYLNRPVAASMGALIVAAKKDGVTISPTDCYRDFAAQVATKKRKGGLAARAGNSNHGWGRAADMGEGTNGYTYPGYLWLKKNAWKFGWGHPLWAEPGGPGKPDEPLGTGSRVSVRL
jgi:D-alanyl-D-alanine carboxypeptidase